MGLTVLGLNKFLTSCCGIGNFTGGIEGTVLPEGGAFELFPLGSNTNVSVSANAVLLHHHPISDILANSYRSSSTKTPTASTPPTAQPSSCTSAQHCTTPASPCTASAGQASTRTRRNTDTSRSATTSPRPRPNLPRGRTRLICLNWRLLGGWMGGRFRGFRIFDCSKLVF